MIKNVFNKQEKIVPSAFQKVIIRSSLRLFMKSSVT